MAPHANLRAHAARWREVLALPPEQVAALLVEDSPRGQLLRETRPVFGRVLSSQDVARLLDAGWPLLWRRDALESRTAPRYM